jgi:PHD/YefM family antitoxin component YafN of YafNO toxin-antitoxin module
MREYNFTEARQQFASILDQAKREGAVCIKRKNGEIFYIKPATAKTSPLDVKGVDLDLSSSQIVDIVREGRERKYAK